jgi:hypothetical protein
MGRYEAVGYLPVFLFQTFEVLQWSHRRSRRAVLVAEFGALSDSVLSLQAGRRLARNSLEVTVRINMQLAFRYAVTRLSPKGSFGRRDISV